MLPQVSHYSDPITEHRAVRQAIGITDLSHRGRLRVTGSDRADFLHRLTTNEVKKLRIGEGNFGMILTNRGKFIAEIIMIVSENAIDLSTETPEILFNELDKYLIADDVEITDLTDQSGMIAINGARSAELVQNVIDRDVSKLSQHHSVIAEFNGDQIVCVRTHETGEIGYHLFVEFADTVPILWKKLISEGENFGVQPIGQIAYETLRIEAGVPRSGFELDGLIIPLEAELENGIAFDKGCYIGQEIIARMKYRGHPNRLLRGFELDADQIPKRNSSIFVGEKEIGRITSAVRSPTLGKVIALGYIRVAHADPKSKIEIQTENERLSAIVAKLPFVQNYK